MAQNKEKDNLPVWDLSEYYASEDDPQIDKDLAQYAKKAENFAQKYRGRVAKLDADEFLEALKVLEQLSQMASRLGGFAHLNSTTKMKETKATALYQKVVEQLTHADRELVFFTLEYNKMSAAAEKKLLSDKRVQKYTPYMERIRRFKPYELKEDVEKTLLEKDVTSGSAWVRYYEEYMARLTYKVQGKVYNDAEISKLSLSADAKIRAAAGKEINRVAKDNSFTVSYIYNMIIKDKATEDEKRGFKRPMSARNLSENVSDKTVDTLAETVRKNYKNIAWRFYKIKAKLLGVKKINYWDRNAPLPIEDDANYSWDDAVKIVLNAYDEFSPKLYNIAKDFFENPWIDAAPKAGKRSGAFCSGPLVTEHPFLMLNFVGKRNDVLTLAHELGHGCHHQLRQKNGILNETTRMTTEEVASVFGEMLVFQSMLNNAKTKQERISLLAMKVNDMINTAIRQIAFHFFEMRVHEERRHGELSAQRFNEIWLEEMKASLGPAVVVDKNSEAIWEQVGHFFFLPFYVYAYSFADCVVNSLYWLKLTNKVENFEDKYLHLLSQTAIGDYKEIFKPFGLNPEKADFWQGGLNLISYYLDELESLLK
ncbi:MAG: M3 family oligoendopeptidase [Alphaproteobacteria bacterium]|nr:M3 family oligoendopeptidase [Alphaproteobacteria bacterium]